MAFALGRSNVELSASPRDSKRGGSLVLTMNDEMADLQGGKGECGKDMITERIY